MECSRPRPQGWLPAADVTAVGTLNRSRYFPKLSMVALIVCALAAFGYIVFVTSRRSRPDRLPTIGLATSPPGTAVTKDGRFEVDFVVLDPHKSGPYTANIIIFATNRSESSAVFVLDNYAGTYVCPSATGHDVWVLRKNGIAILTESNGNWSIHQGFVNRDVPPCLEQARGSLFREGDPQNASIPVEIRQCAANRFPSRCVLTPSTSAPAAGG
jgi:hypothetical protein